MQARKVGLAAIAVAVWHTSTTSNYTALLQKIKKKENLKRAQKTVKNAEEVTGRENTKQEKSQAGKKKTLEFELDQIAKI